VASDGAGDQGAPLPVHRVRARVASGHQRRGTFLYLATVINCYSRRLVGWSIADHMRTNLVTVRPSWPPTRCGQSN
jgi:transposase InsO family protein